MHLFLGIHLVIYVELEELVVEQVPVLRGEPHLEVIDEVGVLSVAAGMLVPLDKQFFERYDILRSFIR